MSNKKQYKPKFPVGDMAQVCIVVPDLDKAVKNFYHTFGIGPWHFYTYGKPLVKRMTRNGEPTEYKMKVALSYFGTMLLELIEPLEGDTVYKEFVEKHGYGVHHLGILTDNMKKSIEKAEDAGINMNMDGAGFGPDDDGHYAYLDTEDLISTTLELIERPKRRNPPEKIYPPEE
ncbi:MAG TPA: VOC family protein [Prolixibacteraceae bacterium]|nr:VOC family protein [Prolixibacteraceae bacterium]